MAKKGKKYTFAKHLKIYSVAATGVLAVAPAAEAAIHYSGLQNLVVNSSTTPVSVDMDGGGADFEFRYTSNLYGETSYSGLLMSALGNNGAIYRTTPNYDWANLSANYSVRNNINAPLSWENSAEEPLAGYDATAGSFNSNGSQGYLGVRFESSTCNNGNYLYGWIQWRTDTRATQGTIIDWAYEDQCNTPIQTGQTQSPATAPIPTMNQWGMMVFTLLLGGLAARMLRKQGKKES